MARKRTPQTFAKRARERDKQMKREAKQADRLARSAAKREAKEERGGEPGEVTLDVINQEALMRELEQVESSPPPKSDD